MSGLFWFLVLLGVFGVGFLASKPKLRKYALPFFLCTAAPPIIMVVWVVAAFGGLGG